MQNQQEILPTLQQNKRGTNQRYFVRSNFVPHLFCPIASIFSHPPPFGAGNKIVLILFFILLCNNISFAQQFQLSEKAKNQIEKNIVNTAVWDKLNQLKMLRQFSPTTIDKQINEIYEEYSFTLVELEYLREIEQINIALQNQKVMQQLNQKPKPTQEDIAELQKKQLQGKAPEQNNQQRIQKEMFDLLQEIRQDEAKSAQNNYYQSEEFLNDVPNYTKAKDLIKSMLDGKIPLSLKDAYYYQESAYGNLHLTYEEYNKLIADNAHFIKQWLSENKYNINDAEALHFGIQKFMSDTIYATINGKKNGHIPYYYDYIDPVAKDDKRNYFVTKILATGGGQCHTMPIVYMILAEQLGVESNLGYTPRHSFIRYPNNSGTIINYEATIGLITESRWYAETVPIIAKGMQNGTFIQSREKRKVIAALVFDLAQNFIEEHGLGNTAFIQDCLDIGTPYFPNDDYICSGYYNVRKCLYANKFNTLVKIYKIQLMSQIEQYPDVEKAYHDFYGYVEKINSLGIQDFTEAEYLQMMAHFDTNKKLQIAKKIDSKSKKSLFINQ